MNFLKQTLTQGAFWQLNKMLLRKLGINPALLLTDLIDKYYYFKDRNLLNKNGFFYCTAKDLEESTTLTYHLQKKAIDFLIESGLIETELKGVPAKVHFKIIEKSVFDLLNSSCENYQNLITSKTTIKEHLKQDIKDFESNNNIDNNKEITINTLSHSFENFNEFLKQGMYVDTNEFLSMFKDLIEKKEEPATITKTVNSENEINYDKFVERVRELVQLDNEEKRRRYITNMGVKPSNEKANEILQEEFKRYAAKRFGDGCNFPLNNNHERLMKWLEDSSRIGFSDFNLWTCSQYAIQNAAAMMKDKPAKVQEKKGNTGGFSQLIKK